MGGLLQCIWIQAIRAERPEVGWTPIQTHRPDLIEPGPWFQWHSDRWVLPDGIRALARTGTAEQAFTAGRSLGVQFHPELTRRCWTAG
jgi:GMP synthase-like glutamine amidotransferase